VVDAANERVGGAIDVTVENHGTIVMVRPVSEAAQTWVKENVQLQGWQWLGGAFAVKPRRVEDLLDGMEAAGLEVQR